MKEKNIQMEKQPHVVKCWLFPFLHIAPYEARGKTATPSSRTGRKIIGIGVKKIADTIAPKTKARTHIQNLLLPSCLAEQTSITQPIINTGTKFAIQNGKPIQQRMSLIQSSTNPNKQTSIIAIIYIKKPPFNLSCDVKFNN